MVIIFPQPFFMTYSEGKFPAMRYLEGGEGHKVARGVLYGKSLK